MLLAEQPVHQRFVRPGPLVLGSTLLKSPTPTADRDRTVSRRSEPRSRTALMGEQPNPWDLLQPQDATIRHRSCNLPVDWRFRCSADYTFILPIRARGRRYDSAHRFARLVGAARPSHRSTERISRYRVITATSVSVRLPTVLPSTRSTSRSGFTVISRSVDDVSIISPLYVEVPNLPVDVTLGGDKPVIPGVAFIR